MTDMPPRLTVRTDNHDATLTRGEDSDVSISYNGLDALNLRIISVSALDDLYEVELTHPQLAEEASLVQYRVHDQGPQTPALHLYHLEVPDALRGCGLGRFALALQHALCTVMDCSYFSIKFGNADESIPFLKRVGFDPLFVDRVQDPEYEWESAVVGDVERTGSGAYDWSLRPVELHNFPTGFFTASTETGTPTLT